MKEQRKLVSAKEIAVVLGVRVETVLGWHRRGVIPGYRAGRRVRFDAAEVIEVIRTSQHGQEADRGN